MNIFSALAKVLRTARHKREDEVIFSWAPDEPNERFTEMLQWCFDHKVIPNHIKDEVKAGMSHRFSLQCPDKATLMLAKLTWGGK